MSSNLQILGNTSLKLFDIDIDLQLPPLQSIQCLHTNNKNSPYSEISWCFDQLLLWNCECYLKAPDQVDPHSAFVLEIQHYYRHLQWFISLNLFQFEGEQFLITTKTICTEIVNSHENNSLTNTCCVILARRQPNNYKRDIIKLNKQHDECDSVVLHVATVLLCAIRIDRKNSLKHTHARQSVCQKIQNTKFVAITNKATPIT